MRQASPSFQLFSEVAYFVIRQLLPRMTRQKPLEKKKYSYENTSLFDHPLPILRARRLMPAEAVRVEMA